MTGGLGRPSGIDKGYFVKPTIFAGVNNEMTIAREEICGPVRVLIPYMDDADAFRIAHDSIYGLSGHVHSGNIENARRVASQIRTGMIHVNGAARDMFAPFGGYKQSGNGREWGREGFKEFLEAIQCGLLLMKADGTVHHCNKAAVEILGLKAKASRKAFNLNQVMPKLAGLKITGNSDKSVAEIEVVPGKLVSVHAKRASSGMIVTLKEAENATPMRNAGAVTSRASSQSRGPMKTTGRPIAAMP